MTSETKNRCILIFPQFDNAEVIDEVRRQYDPSFKHIAFHITLVFPFESSISKQALQKHVEDSIGDLRCFELMLHGVKQMDGNNYYLMLDVLYGEENVRKMHERLYTGMLLPYKPNWQEGFIPHMTIGQFGSCEELNEAYRELVHFKEVFSARICEVCVEIIGENSEAIIEFTQILEP